MRAGLLTQTVIVIVQILNTATTVVQQLPTHNRALSYTERQNC